MWSDNHDKTSFHEIYICLSSIFFAVKNGCSTFSLTACKEYLIPFTVQSQHLIFTGQWACHMTLYTMSTEMQMHI